MIELSDPHKYAPEPLRLVQEFVNSVDVETGEDELDTTAGVRKWFRAHGLIAAKSAPDEEEREAAIDVREGLRELLLENNGGPPAPAAIERLEAAAGRASLRTTFAPGREPQLEADCSGVDGGIARLLAIVATSAADGTWSRLKACAADDCRAAFYDHSRNRSGKWCVMDVCGNRNKARAFRDRRSATSS